MIDLMKRFFEKREDDVSPGRGGGPRHDVRIATCALFLEMAGIDGEFDPVERDRILSILMERFELSKAHASGLLAASEKELEHSIDLWQFTNQINENYSRREKIEIIELVWTIVYMDGKLDQHEDYLVHKLAKLLRLNHAELIDAKIQILHGKGSGETQGPSG
jgi:uncharacterized tellurite resistance protein B-like protein